MPVLRQAADDKTASIAPTAKRAEGAARKEAGLSQESPVVMSWRQSGEAPKARPGARTEATPRQAGGAQPTPEAHSPVAPVHRHASSDGQWARSQEGSLGSQQGRPRVSVRGMGGGGRGGGSVGGRVTSPSGGSTSSRSSSASASMTTWGLRAQRRERQLWQQCVARLVALPAPPPHTQDNTQVLGGEALSSREGVLLKVLGELSTLCLPVPLVSKEEGGQLLALLCSHAMPLLHAYTPQQALPLSQALCQWVPLLIHRQPPALHHTHRVAVLRCLVVVSEGCLACEEPSPLPAPLALLTQVLCVESLGGGAKGGDEGLYESLLSLALSAAQPCSRLGPSATPSPPPCPWPQCSAALGLVCALLSPQCCLCMGEGGEARARVGAFLLDVLQGLAPLHQAALLHPQLHDTRQWPYQLCLCLLHGLRGLQWVVGASAVAPLHNPTQAGTLLLAINQVLQPLVVSSSGREGSCAYHYPGTSDIAPSRRTPPPSPKRHAAPPSPPITHQPPTQAEEGVEVVLACVRVCALQVAATLAQRAPHCVLAHWMLLLPLHLHPPTPTKPSKPVVLRGPGVAPVLVVLLECRDGPSLEAAAGAVLALLSALPLHQWLEAAAMGLRAKPVRGKASVLAVGGGFLGDRVVAMVTALHQALAALLTTRPCPPYYCTDLAKSLATLLSAVPYSCSSGPPRPQGEGCVSAWEGVLATLAQHSLSLLHHAHATLFNANTDTGSRHGAAQLLSLCLSTSTTGLAVPSLPLPPTAHPITSFLLQPSSPSFVLTVLRAARGLGGLQPEALLLLARLARYHGGLLLAPPPMTLDSASAGEGVGEGVRGCLQETLVSSFQHGEQNVRLHALKALEDLLTWATTQDPQATQAQWLLTMLLRPLFRGCSDPYHGVRSLSCSCLALLLTLQPLAQWINDTDTQRRTDTTQLLCLVVDLASGDPTSGVKAAAVRVLGLVLGQDKGLEAVAQLGLVTKACNAMVTAAHDDKVAVRAQGVWALGNLPCPPTSPDSTDTPGLRLSDCVEEDVLVSMAKAALAALAPTQPHSTQPTQRVKASAVRALGVAAALLGDTTATHVQDECVCALSECVRAEGLHDQAALKCQWNACHALVSLLCPTGALAARLVPPLPAPHWASDLFLSLCVAMGSVGQGDACGGGPSSSSTSSGGGAVSPRGSAQADHKVRAYACQALAAPPTRHVYGHAFAPVLLAAVQALRESLFCPEVSLLLMHLLKLAQEGEDSQCLADAAVMRGEGGPLLYQWLALLRQSRADEVRAVACKVEAALVHQAMHQEEEQDDKAAQDDALERFRFLIASLDRQRSKQQGTEEDEEL